MRKFPVVVAAILVIATPALADAFARQPKDGAFWLNDQAWPDPQAHPVKPPAPRFTLTYTDGVASRLGVTDGRLDLFERRLNGPGESGPAFVGAVDHGAAEIRLRWNPGE